MEFKITPTTDRYIRVDFWWFVSHLEKSLESRGSRVELITASQAAAALP